MRFLALLLMTVLAVGCSEQQVESKESAIQSQEDLIQFNIAQKEKEMRRIAAYIERREWAMTCTQTGLCYYRYSGEGKDSIRTGDVVSFNFNVELLDGRQVYSSDSLGTRTVKVGQSEAESGLHEAFTYLSTGDKAKIIIPSHLAFGLTGDHHKIPSAATLVYDVEILNVQ